MSKLLMAGRLIVDSQQKDLLHSFHIFSTIIGLILDHPRLGSAIPQKTIHFKKELPSKTVSIAGFNLGDTVDILGKSDIDGCIRGVRGRITVLCELGGQIERIDLSDIAAISKEGVIISSPPSPSPDSIVDTGHFFRIMSASHSDVTNMSIQ